jgi:hypothetical protein
VTLWIALKQRLSFDGVVDVFGWNCRLLLHEPMGNHGGRPPVEKLQHAVVQAGVHGAKFMDAVAEIVALGAAQLVPKLLKTVEANTAPGAGHWWERGQPVDERDRSIVLTEENNLDSRQQPPPPRFATLRTSWQLPRHM